MSIYNFPGYLAHSRKSLGGELIGFNAKTGRPVYAAAGVGVTFRCPPRGVSGPDGIGSYSDLSTDFYQTYQHENWQHPGSEGWSSANVPGWGNNPNLQMFSRLAVHGLGDEALEPPPPPPSWFEKHNIWPAVVSGVIIAVMTGVTLAAISKYGAPSKS